MDSDGPRHPEWHTVNSTRGPNLAASPASRSLGWAWTRDGPASGPARLGPGPARRLALDFRLGVGPSKTRQCPPTVWARRAWRSTTRRDAWPCRRSDSESICSAARSSTDRSASGHQRRLGRRLLGQGPDESRVGSRPWWRETPTPERSPPTRRRWRLGARIDRDRVAQRCPQAPLALLGKGGRERSGARAERERHATCPPRALATRRRQHTHGAAERRCPPTAEAREG
jgi:hypothetical protein